MASAIASAMASVMALSSRDSEFSSPWNSRPKRINSSQECNIGPSELRARGFNHTKNKIKVKKKIESEDPQRRQRNLKLLIN